MILCRKTTMTKEFLAKYGDADHIDKVMTLGSAMEKRLAYEKSPFISPKHIQDIVDDPNPENDFLKSAAVHQMTPEQIDQVVNHAVIRSDPTSWIHFDVLKGSPHVTTEHLEKMLSGPSDNWSLRKAIYTHAKANDAMISKGLHDPVPWIRNDVYAHHRPRLGQEKMQELYKAGNVQ
jgi:hypothetical protein